VELFHDLALDESTLEIFSDRATPYRKGIHCHCGLPKLPDRQEICDWLCEPTKESDLRCRPESTVRSVKVQRARQGQDYVPMLRIKGHWLKLFGFHESCPLREPHKSLRFVPRR
jgi:hypothetical protein